MNSKEDCESDSLAEIESYLLNSQPDNIGNNGNLQLNSTPEGEHVLEIPMRDDNLVSVLLVEESSPVENFNFPVSFEKFQTLINFEEDVVPKVLRNFADFDEGVEAVLSQVPWIGSNIMMNFYKFFYTRPEFLTWCYVNEIPFPCAIKELKLRDRQPFAETPYLKLLKVQPKVECSMEINLDFKRFIDQTDIMELLDRKYRCKDVDLAFNLFQKLFQDGPDEDLENVLCNFVYIAHLKDFFDRKYQYAVEYQTDIVSEDLNKNAHSSKSEEVMVIEGSSQEDQSPKYAKSSTSSAIHQSILIDGSAHSSKSKEVIVIEGSSQEDQSPKTANSCPCTSIMPHNVTQKENAETKTTNKDESIQTIFSHLLKEVDTAKFKEAERSLPMTLRQFETNYNTNKAMKQLYLDMYQTRFQSLIKKLSPSAFTQKVFKNYYRLYWQYEIIREKYPPILRPNAKRLQLVEYDTAVSDDAIVKYIQSKLPEEAENLSLLGEMLRKIQDSTGEKEDIVQSEEESSHCQLSKLICTNRRKKFRKHKKMRLNELSLSADNLPLINEVAIRNKPTDGKAIILNQEIFMPNSRERSPFVLLTNHENEIGDKDAQNKELKLANLKKLSKEFNEILDTPALSNDIKLLNLKRLLNEMTAVISQSDAATAETCQEVSTNDKSIALSQQLKTVCTSPILSLPSSGSTDKPCTLSQALFGDTSLFNSLTLEKVMGEIITEEQTMTEESNSIPANVYMQPLLHTITNNAKPLIYFQLQTLDYIQQLSATDITKMNLQANQIGKSFMQATISLEYFQLQLHGTNLLSMLYAKIMPNKLKAVEKLLFDSQRYHYSCFNVKESTSNYSDKPLNERLLDLFFKTANGFANGEILIKFGNCIEQNSHLTPIKSFKNVTSGDVVLENMLHSDILNSMRELCEGGKNKP